MALTVSEIAEKLDGVVEGAGDAVVTGLAAITDARPGDITFLANSRYAAALAGTKATAVVVDRQWNKPCPAALVRVDQPDRAFAELARWFAPPSVDPAPGIHPSAVVAPDARLGEDVHIGPYCIVEPGVSIGDRTILWAHCYVGQDTTIGSDGRFFPHVGIRERCEIGSRVTIHNGSVIGSDGFGYTVDSQGVRKKILQIGTVCIGDDVEIGANVTIDRARFGRTVIGRGVKIDNLVQIAHNVVIEDDAVIIAQVGIAGSTRIGPGAILAGQAGISGHLVIGQGAIVGAQAGVTKDVHAGTFVSGYPAAPHEKAVRIHAHLMRLPELKARVANLEERLAKLLDGRRTG